VAEMADRVEQFANLFVSKARVLTACFASAERWAEIDPNHPDAVAVRKAIAKIDPAFSCMLNDLVKLTKDYEAYLLGKEPRNAALCVRGDEQRIAAAVGEMTAVVREYTKQRERYDALPPWVEDTTEFLIGSHRFFRESAYLEAPQLGRKTQQVVRSGPGRLFRMG
jgi:hypothetical protein